MEIKDCLYCCHNIIQAIPLSYLNNAYYLIYCYTFEFKLHTKVKQINYKLLTSVKFISIYIGFALQFNQLLSRKSKRNKLVNLTDPDHQESSSIMTSSNIIVCMTSLLVYYVTTVSSTWLKWDWMLEMRMNERSA